MSVDDGFTNIRRGSAAYQTSGVTKQVSRPSSQTSTTATESSDSSSVESAHAASAAITAAPRLPAWKLREAAKASGAPVRSISNSSTGRPPKMTMEVGTPTGSRRAYSNARAAAAQTIAPIMPNLQADEENEEKDVDITSRSGRAVRAALRAASRERRATSRDPTSRVREPSSQPQGTSRERPRNRSESIVRSSSRERTRTRSSSTADPNRARSSSREPWRASGSTDEVPATPSTVRTAPVRGTRRAMRKSDLAKNDEAIPSMFNPQEPSSPTTSGRSYLKPPKKANDQPENTSIVEMPSKKAQLQRELSTQSFGAAAFPSTFSFDNDDPFETSRRLVNVKPQILEAKVELDPVPPKREPDPEPPKRKSSKTPKTFKKKVGDDDLSSVPSMFRASLEYDKKLQKKSSKKSSSKSKTEGNDEGQTKCSTKKKKKRDKNSDPEPPRKTRKSKKATKRSKTPTKDEKGKENESKERLPDGFDWEVPITPVFETPVSKAPKKKLGSKEDILANSKDTSEAFHNSLDNLFELPADLLSPSTGKIKMDENTMPIIAFSDDASHASDMSSIHSISEYSEMDHHGKEEPSTPLSRAKQRVSGINCDRSVRSQRSGASRVTAGTRGTRNSLNSCSTASTAWQLREQQKHARRPAGRRGYSMQTPKTAPARTRRAMTTHLQHQQIPLPPAFSALSAPTTPRTPAMDRRLMSSKEKQAFDTISSHRRGNIADSLLYFAGEDEERSVEPDLLSQCSRSVYSTRSHNLKRPNSKPVDQRMAIPKNARLETNPVTGKQQLVVDLGDVPAAFRASMR